MLDRTHRDDGGDVFSEGEFTEYFRSRCRTAYLFAARPVRLIASVRFGLGELYELIE